MIEPEPDFDLSLRNEWAHRKAHSAEAVLERSFEQLEGDQERLWDRLPGDPDRFLRRPPKAKGARLSAYLSTRTKPKRFLGLF